MLQAGFMNMIYGRNYLIRNPLSQNNYVDTLSKILNITSIDSLFLRIIICDDHDS